MKRQILSLPELAEKFKDLCHRKGYHMKEVLSHAGLPEYTSKWRKGEGRAPSYRELALMAEKLDVPVEVFIYKDRDPFVHIPEEKYEELIGTIEDQLQQIETATKDIRKSDLFNYQKYTG